MRLVLNLVVLYHLLCCIGCSTVQQFGAGGSDRRLLKAIASNPVFTKHHTGFALYDPEERKWLCQFNADKYFTPASNTKILTLLTCLHVLGDSIETYRYRISGDSLLFYGMGDPSFLYDAIPSSLRPLEILREFPGMLYYQPVVTSPAFGPGWAWDDYPYSYQVERSALPVFGNRIRVYQDMFGELHVEPSYYADYVAIDSSQNELLVRDPVANAFTWNDRQRYYRDTAEAPFIISDYDVTQILSGVVGKHVGTLYDLNGINNHMSVHSSARDSLLKMMMQESDNFIAEQLLMQCAFYMRGTLESDSAIAVAQRMIMAGAPDPLQWVDGSGLSRYNLFTPRSLVWILEQIMHLQSMDHLTAIFPAGGQSGTIKEWYAAEMPYVFAKTGTLYNQHCLSGYLYTDSGKWLIFSFMHNNFTGESADIKKEMEKVLLSIKKKY